MLRVGPYQAALSTGFWLSEVGPQYRLNAYVRDPKSKIFLQISPNATTDGQVSVETLLAGLPLLGRLRGAVSGALWDQRGQAEPGGKKAGASVGAGLDLRVLRRLVLSAYGGYKTRGAQLGRQFEEGGFAEGGLRYED
jgi:hypothetical protein